MTIKDIARLSGVSVSTVSRVLNNRQDVSEESRRRVRSVIENESYIPNNTARDLVKTKSDAIGLVVRGISNPFYTDVITAIEKEIENAGYTMVMRQIASDADEIQCGAEMERAVIDADHQPGDWEVDTDSTCSSEGKRVRKCKVCPEILETEIIPRKDHPFDGGPQCPACGEKNPNYIPPTEPPTDPSTGPTEGESSGE